MIFHNKKGEEYGDSGGSEPQTKSYKLLIDLILVALILVVMLQYYQHLPSKQIMEQVYLSKELSLIINGIYTLPGNVLVTYTYPDLALFNYDFHQQQVQVKNPITGAEEKYPYLEDKTLLSSLPLLLQPTSLEFLKSGNELKIGEKTSGNLLLLKCPEEPTHIQKRPPVMLFIEPGTFSDQEYELLHDTLHDEYAFLNDYETVSVQEKIARIEKEKPGIVLLFRKMTQNETKNSLLIIVPPYTSSRYGCLFSNALTSHTMFFTGSNVVPIEGSPLFEALKEEDFSHRIILAEVVLGNTAFKQTLDPPIITKVVDESLDESLEEYYGQ